ncbi:MAG TPA: tripartite tricarboxylate transporter substrate binding protein [Usitatibacter sp.]|nr:tripartite tricarboxylate transporter substrate binding protein [Usitatibacter sp.]
MIALTRALVTGALSALLAFATGDARAQAYPSKPIDLILPSTAGGTTDVAVRLLAARWSEFLGQPIVVHNVPGSGGVIGANRVARAKPDGYTLMGGFDSLLVALPFVQKQVVEYELDSFDYITGFGLGSLYFTVRAESPYKTMKDLVAAARTGQAKLTYGSYGIGVITHFAAERLWDMTGAKLTYVPYKSSPETVTALLGGHIDVAVTAGLGAFANNPRVRVLGVANERRRADLPDIPTLKEQGYDVTLEYISGVQAPKGLPPEVRAKLDDAVQKAHEKYGSQFKEEILKKSDLVYVNMPGAEMHRIWKERQSWFREVAPKMNLDKR